MLPGFTEFFCFFFGPSNRRSVKGGRDWTNKKMTQPTETENDKKKLIFPSPPPHHLPVPNERERERKRHQSKKKIKKKQKKVFFTTVVALLLFNGSIRTVQSTRTGRPGRNGPSFVFASDRKEKKKPRRTTLRLKKKKKKPKDWHVDVLISYYGRWPVFSSFLTLFVCVCVCVCVCVRYLLWCFDMISLYARPVMVSFWSTAPRRAGR